MCCCSGEDIVFLATDINLPGAVDWVMMQSCFDHNFMLVLEKQERYEGQQLFYAIVQLIGTKKQAENFAYRYTLLNFADGTTTATAQLRLQMLINLQVLLNLF